MALESRTQGQAAVAPHAPESPAGPAEEFPSPRQTKWALLCFLVYFGLRLLFFAVAIAPSVPPDEDTHFGIIQVFSKVFLLPVNTPETYQYGLVTHIPWLYYWIMGKLLYLNAAGIPDLIFLRILNIPLAFATVYYAWRTLRILTDDRLAQMLLMVVMTNTLMYTFLSAAVSYDNLTNLLAAMSVYYLFAFIKNRSDHQLAIALLCQLAGCLTKQTFLPLVLVLNIVLCVHEFRKLPDLPSALASWFRTLGRRKLVLTLALLLGLSLNVKLYVGNYLQFGKPDPGMAEVLSPEIAMQNRILARNIIFNLFVEGKISKERALAMTSSIRHQGDRASAVALIEGYDYRQKSSGYHVMGLPAYLSFWTKAMLHGTYGIFAHLPVPQSAARINLFRGLFLVAGLSFLIRWRPKKAGWSPLYLAIIAGFYGSFLMYVINYSSYLDTKATWLGLQGRYIFPVMSPIYVLLSCYLMQLFSGSRTRLAVFSVAAVIFIACDLPFFLSFATPDWFAWPQSLQLIMFNLPGLGNWRGPFS